MIENVAQTHPGIRFLVLSVSDAPEDVIAMIRAGVRGYVTKTIEAPDLADAVRRVHAGDAVFSPRLAGFVLDAFAGAIPSDPASATPSAIVSSGRAARPSSLSVPSAACPGPLSLRRRAAPLPRTRSCRRSILCCRRMSLDYGAMPIFLEPMSTSLPRVNLGPASNTS